MLIAYTSRTGTRETLSALHAAEWRQLVAPGQRPTHARGWMLDNGAWSAHRRGRPLDLGAFVRHLTRWGRHADLVVTPDIVAGGLASLDLSLSWLAACLWNCRRALIPVQDGMEPRHLDGVPLGHRVGIFVGGSTEWKLETCVRWGRYARARRCWLHVGRVNSAKRIDLCRAAGADSFDGKSPVLFPPTLRMLDEARRQLGLFGRAIG